MKTFEPSQLRNPALAISAIYITVGICWILASDKAVLLLFDEPEEVQLSQMLKGWLYVATTGVLLYFLVRSYFRTLLRSHAQLAQAELAARRLAAAVEQTTECVLLSDTNGRVVYANPALSTALEAPQEELIQGEVLRIWGAVPDDQRFAAIWPVAVQGKAWAGTWAATSRGGRSLQFSGSATPVLDEHGKLRHIAFVFRDISREMARERRKRQQEKLEAIGTLASGIAHDFNNILFAISGNVELARLDFGDIPGLTEYLNQIHDASRRAQELTHQILVFTRNAEQEFQPTTVTPLVKEVLKLVRSTIPTNIEISQDYRTDEDFVIGDPTRLTQVWMNLCTNAFQAMEQDGGRLSVIVESVTVDSHLAEEVPRLHPGPYCRVTVTDTGPGMDEATRDRIFEPFFTTKQEGTGLGLATVHGIIKDHGGAISVSSEPGRGTVFQVYLPQAEIAPAATTNEATVSHGNGERVLYIDDDEALIRVVVGMLRHLGYRGDGCLGSRRALELLAAQPDAYDVVITDLMMPHMTGVELAREIRTRLPALPLLLASGSITEETEEMARRFGIRKLMKKPLSLERLASALWECLHQA